MGNCYIRAFCARRISEFEYGTNTITYILNKKNERVIGMEVNGYKIKMDVEYPDGTVKVINQEQLRELAPKLNEISMRSVGAVPVNKENAVG